MSTSSQDRSFRTEKGERKRAKILRALEREGGKATTSEIKKHVGFGSDLIRSHCRVLENERTPPQVELSGKVHNSQKALNATNEYRLTEHGQAILDGLGDDQLSLEEAESFAELRSELVELKKDYQELRDAHNELVKTVQKLQS